MVPQLSPLQFKDWLGQQNAPVTVLDVREVWEAQTASITADGFDVQHIVMSDVPMHLAALSREEPIACLCHHGARSDRVAQFLVQNGFTQVVNLAGGIAAWSQTLDPSVPQY